MAEEQGFGDQFHPYYTRMVPAHYLVTIQLVGCPIRIRPTSAFSIRFETNTPPTSTPSGTTTSPLCGPEVRKWVDVPENEPIGCCCPGHDSGAVFLSTYSVMRELGRIG